jgi:hypothetical protein
MIPRAMLAVVYTTGRASHPRQVKCDDPDKKGYPGPPGWGFSVGLKTPHIKKLIVTKVEQREKMDRFNDDGRKRTKDTKITLATWNEIDLQVLGVRRWREMVTGKEMEGLKSQHVSVTIAAIFRVMLLLQDYTCTNAVTCVAVTP